MTIADVLRREHRCARCQLVIAPERRLFTDYAGLGYCGDCLAAGVSRAEAVALEARIERYVASAPDAADERHAGHELPVAGCLRCRRARL